LKPEKTASSKKRKVESILSNEINLSAGIDEVSSSCTFLILLNPLDLAKQN
jgi:hypothetical protein